MSQVALEGKDAVLEAWDGSQWLPFVCATNVEFTCDTELIERKGPGLQGFKSFVAGESEWGITLQDVSVAVPEGATKTVFYTLLESVRKNGLDIHLVFADSLGNLQVINGHVKIPHTGIAAPVDGFVESTIEFKGDGPFAITTTLVNPGSISTLVFDPIDFTATGGETSLTYSDLINRTILGVWRDGLEKEVVTSGSINEKQVKYDDTAGTIFFAAPLNAGEKIHILYK